jgi:hypothetical protein
MRGKVNVRSAVIEHPLLNSLPTFSRMASDNTDKARNFSLAPLQTQRRHFMLPTRSHHSTIKQIILAHVRPFPLAPQHPAPTPLQSSVLPGRQKLVKFQDVPETAEC